MEAALRRQKVKERMERNFKTKIQQLNEQKLLRKEFKQKIQPPAKPKFIELEENFQKQEEEAKEKRKRILGMIKQISKPMNFAQLQEHTIKQDKIQEEFRDRRDKERAAMQLPKMSNYKSKFYQRINEQEQVRKEMEEAKEELKQLMADKKVNYAKYVQECHMPSVSFTKQKQMENLIDRLKHPVRDSTKVSPGSAMLTYSASSYLNRSSTQVMDTVKPPKPRSITAYRSSRSNASSPN